MANEIKYAPQEWGEPIKGERLSTNGHYTGEQHGTTTQDALVEMIDHFVEENVVRLGTITQDVLNDIKLATGGGNTMTIYVDDIPHTVPKCSTLGELASLYSLECKECGTTFNPLLEDYATGSMNWLGRYCPDCTIPGSLPLYYFDGMTDVECRPDTYVSDGDKYITM